MTVQSPDRNAPRIPFRLQAVLASLWLMGASAALLSPLASGQDRDASAKRSPVPARAKIDATLKTVRGLYAEQYQNRQPQAQRDFAISLLAVADEDSQLPAKYVLYSEALRISQGLGDYQTAWKAIDKISRRFEVDDIRVRAKLLTDFGKKNRDPDLAYNLTLLVQPKIQSLVDQNQFPAAIRLTESLESVAKRSRNKVLARDLTNSQKEMERLAKQYAALRPAYAALKQNPDDPPSNQSVGYFLFFEKGDYREAIPFLAKSDVPQLTAIAKQEMKTRRDSEATDKDRLAIADRWWNLAASVEDEERQTKLRGHAAGLYSELASGLAGIDKVRVQKRIQDQFSLQDDFFGAVWEIPWKTQDNWVGVQFRKDGKVRYTIKETQELKTVDWQATARGLLVQPSQKRYFIFNLDSQGNLFGEKYEPKQFRERATGVRTN
ncbi:MAG: hypothetical protein MK108_05480 [Mariniblastus sp.]|nr:hypothetical protein [Mariniblastus sp.]